MEYLDLDLDCSYKSICWFFTIFEYWAGLNQLSASFSIWWMFLNTAWLLECYENVSKTFEPAKFGQKAKLINCLLSKFGCVQWFYELESNLKVIVIKLQHAQEPFVKNLDQPRELFYACLGPVDDSRGQFYFFNF